MASKRKPTKEEVEAAQLSRFLEVSGLLPGATPQRLPSDPPDFVAEHEEKRNAIEVTRVFTDDRAGSLLRASETNRAWICRQLEAQLPQVGVKPLRVSLGFAHDDLTGAERGPLAATILELVRAHDPSDDRPVDLDSQAYLARDDRESGWSESLDHVTLVRPVGWSRYQVMNAESGFGAPPQRLLHAAIDDKECDLPRYEHEYDETWLLMVAESTGQSSFIESDQESRDQLYRVAFDRAFFHGFGSDWFELKRA